MQTVRPVQGKERLMELRWLGAAGFKITSGGTVLLTDPFLRRNPEACPCQPMTPDDLGPADRILISHGHFDHLMDVPAVVRATGAMVACSPGAAGVLEHNRVDPKRIIRVTRDGFALSVGGVRATGFHSRHIRTDLRLSAATLFRSAGQIRKIFSLFRGYPCGRVLSWRIEAEGQTLHFFGSGGATGAELERFAASQTDILLLPLQGHSRICDLALDYVRILRPGLVIPHHHDDFYPPVSTCVDISSFLGRIPAVSAGTRVWEPVLNTPLVF